MSFSWAKSALALAVQAQKKIDSVLDIQEEEDGDEDEVEGEAKEGGGDWDVEDPTGAAITDEPMELVGGVNEVSMHAGSLTTSSSSEKTYAPTNYSKAEVLCVQPTDWSTSPNTKEEVIDAEPNPIRDAHEQSGSIFQYSPSSVSHTHLVNFGNPTVPELSG